MTPAERLNEVLRITKTNVKSLSERLGYARPQGLYDVAAGRTKNLSQDLCRRIVTAFPEFNRTWLLTGDGEMLTTFPSEHTTFPSEHTTFPPEGTPLPLGDVAKISLNLSETIKEQQSTIAALTEIVNRLTTKQG